MDPEEQKAARYRLFARAIKVTGRAQIAALQPFLQSRLEQSWFHAMGSKRQADGNRICVAFLNLAHLFQVGLP